MDPWDLIILRNERLDTLQETVRARCGEGWRLMCLVARVHSRTGSSPECGQVGPPFVAVLQKGAEGGPGIAPPLQVLRDPAPGSDAEVECISREAERLAREGQFARGYTLLLQGLDVARFECGEGDSATVSLWQAALEDFCRRHAGWLT